MGRRTKIVRQGVRVTGIGCTFVLLAAFFSPAIFVAYLLFDQVRYPDGRCVDDTFDEAFEQAKLFLEARLADPNSDTRGIDLRGKHLCEIQRKSRSGLPDDPYAVAICRDGTRYIFAYAFIDNYCDVKVVEDYGPYLQYLQ
jgi:hypothetical protein